MAAFAIPIVMPVVVESIIAGLTTAATIATGAAGGVAVAKTVECLKAARAVSVTVGATEATGAATAPLVAPAAASAAPPPASGNVPVGGFVRAPSASAVAEVAMRVIATGQAIDTLNKVVQHFRSADTPASSHPAESSPPQTNSPPPSAPGNGEGPADPKDPKDKIVKASKPVISKRAMKELLDKRGREMYSKLKDLSSGRGTGVIWKDRNFRIDAGALRDGQRTWNLQVNREAELRAAKALRDEFGTH